MKSVLILFFLFMGAYGVAGSKLDSVKTVANNPNEQDSLRLEALLVLSSDIDLVEDVDTMLVYINKLFNFSIKKQSRENQVEALYFKGTAYLMIQEFEQAAIEFKKCAILASRYNLKEREGYSYLNLAGTYAQQGDFLKAIKIHHLCREVFHEAEDSVGYAGSFLNEGIIHAERKNYISAIDCFRESKSIFELVGHDRGYALSILNLGAVYTYQNQDDSALVYFHKSLEINIASESIEGQALCYMNIGSIYDNMDSLDLSFDALEKSLKFYNLLGNRAGSNKALVLSNLANYYEKKRQFKKALNFSNESYNYALTMDSQILLRQIAKNHSRILFSCGDYKNSTLILERYVELNDSIQDEEVSQKILHEKYTVEAIKDSLSFATQKELSDLKYQKKINDDKLLLDEEADRNMYLFIGVVCLTLIGLVMLVGYRRKKTDNIIINDKKEELETQKIVLENKNREVYDSIVYAKRIQTAILPTKALLNKYLKDYFIMYKPKDIVAGDFYWMEIVDEKVMFAVADCTGHGVPGAIVSVFCHSCLNRAVREFKLSDPGEILNKTRELLVLEFEKSEENVMDGMDIALCVLEGDKLMYAGANNPAWVFRNGELIELRANRQPVGNYFESKPFTSHSINLLSKDRLYLTTDGYTDQFGGEKGKKFRVKTLKELLGSIQEKELSEQYAIIESSFEEWKSNFEQLDDVCFLGYEHY